MQASMGLESVCGVIGTKGQAFAGAIPHSLGRYSHICCKALLPTGERDRRWSGADRQRVRWISCKCDVNKQQQQQMMTQRNALGQLSRLKSSEKRCHTDNGVVREVK